VIGPRFDRRGEDGDTSGDDDAAVAEMPIAEIDDGLHHRAAGAEDPEAFAHEDVGGLAEHDVARLRLEPRHVRCAVLARERSADAGDRPVLDRVHALRAGARGGEREDAGSGAEIDDDITTPHDGGDGAKKCLRTRLVVEERAMMSDEVGKAGRERQKGCLRAHARQDILSPMRARVVWLFVLATLVACGLDAVGLLPTDGSGAPDGGASSGNGSCSLNAKEQCDDDFDNDCNGKKDCDDPACMATHVCVAQPDGDWLVTLLVASSRDADAGDGGDAGNAADGGDAGDGGSDAGAVTCPAGWKTPTDVVENPRPADDHCGCRCNPWPAKNPCTEGTFQVGVQPNGPGCGSDAGALTASNDCTQASSQIANSAKVDSPGLTTPTSTSCPGTSVVPPIARDANHTLCFPDNAGTCSGGACVPRATGTSCALHAGTVACPPSLPRKRAVVVAKDLVDNRSCAACTCTSMATGCKNRVLHVYSDNACKADERTVTLDSNCNDWVGGATTWSYLKYTATPDPATCNPPASPATVSGALTVPTPSTLCCAE